MHQMTFSLFSRLGAHARANQQISSVFVSRNGPSDNPGKPKLCPCLAPKSLHGSEIRSQQISHDFISITVALALQSHFQTLQQKRLERLNYDRLREKNFSKVLSDGGFVNQETTINTTAAAVTTATIGNIGGTTEVSHAGNSDSGKT